jgi:hypothetical protein
MNVQTMRRLRQFHHYIGVFLAPAIIFFAISGGLQTFRLQEAKGWGGTPPGWIVWMASAHKDQAGPRVKKPGPAAAKPAGDDDEAGKAPAAAQAEAAAPAPAKPAEPAAKRPSNLALKIFVAVMSVGLVLSTLLGVVIAINNRSMRRVSIIMLVAGTALPLMLFP